MNTPVYSYAATAGAWQLYKPQAAYGFLGLSQDNLDEMAMYIHHHIDHYEVVTSIQ